MNPSRTPLLLLVSLLNIDKVLDPGVGLSGLPFLTKLPIPTSIDPGKTSILPSEFPTLIVVSWMYTREGRRTEEVTYYRNLMTLKDESPGHEVRGHKVDDSVSLQFLNSLNLRYKISEVWDGRSFLGSSSRMRFL